MNQQTRAPRIAFLSAEVAPLAKVGGLGDVAGSLPVALQRAGASVMIVMPRYGSIDLDRNGIEATGLATTAEIGGRTYTFRIFRHLLRGTVPVLLLDDPDLFGEPRVYIDERDRERFFAFSRAALDALLAAGFRPDVLHCNDWHTGMAVVHHRELRRHDPRWAGQSSIITIHNVAHQGITDVDYAAQLGYPVDGLMDVERDRYPNTINVLARAIDNADLITTVSPSYAGELQTAEFGNGIDPLLRRRAGDLYGILNGIDIEVFNPATDPHIAARYAMDDTTGKAVCKRRLQEEAGLAVDPAMPLIGVVSRLDDQKGFDLIVQALGRIIGSGAQFVALGTGDPRHEEALAAAARRFPESAGIFLKFDAALAQRIYAGSDFFLMPSRFEPCGLGQMIAMRYGTIPVVRKTGGLADTVTEWDAGAGSGNGFLFVDYDPRALAEAVERAMTAFHEPSHWRQLIRNAMSTDVSWERSALEYIKVYNLAFQAGAHVGLDTVKGERGRHGGTTAT
jgi:starch synthase